MEFSSNDGKTQKERDFRKSVFQGYTVIEGYTLGVTDKDRAAWNELLAHLNNKLSLSQITELDPVYIKDMSGTMQTVTFTRYKEIVAEIGDHYIGLWLQSQPE